MCSLVKYIKCFLALVVALPSPILASSMPIPFMATGKFYPFPCYGGEQKRPSVYAREGIPLPIIELNGGTSVSMADASYQWQRETCFAGEVNAIRHVHEFQFNEHEIRVLDLI